MSRLAYLLAIAACSGESHGAGDGGVDAPADASDVCGATSIHVTGEYVDWDSTAASFKGIAAATLTAQADPTKTAVTAASGRFELCLANDAQALVDVAPPAPYIDGTIVVLKDVTGSNGNFELRAFTKDRAFDTTKAQVFVQIIGGTRAVDVSSKHDAGLHFTGTAWVAGETGASVYLPNVDPDGGSTKLVIANATPLSTIPLAAGRFTYVVLVAH